MCPIVKARLQALEQLVKLQALSYLNTYGPLYKDPTIKELINRYKKEIRNLNLKSEGK